MLFHYYHPLHLSERWRGQLVKIDAARNSFALIVAAIPIGGTPSVAVETHRLESKR
jgi:hypothetical protein